MAEISTAALHARADASAGAGDFPNALRAAAEALHASPGDHRARLKVALCFAMLGQADVAVATLAAVVRQLAGAGFLLPALGACRDALGVQPDAPAIIALLSEIHAAIAGRHSRTRARVPPPVVPVKVDEARTDSFLLMDDTTLAGAAASLGASLPENTPTTVPDAAVPFFSDLSKEAFTSLVGRLEYMKVPAEHTVLTQGDEGTSLYILIEGQVAVCREDEGQSRELARLGPGSLFGELALITDRPRYATVKTTHASELFAVDRKLVDELTSAHKELAGDIAAFARRRVLMNMMATSKVFASVDEEGRQALLSAFEPRVVDTKTRLINEGAEAQGLFVVVEGEVEISKTDDAGDTVVLAYLKEGEVFGEIALIEDRPTTATATAATRAVVLFLGKDRFAAFVDEHPEVQSYLSGLSAERLEENEESMGDGVILEADDLIIL